MKNFKQIIQAGLLVGTLDIVAACVHFFLNTNREPSPVFKFIASGIFGSSAFSGGSEMIIAGLIFHYIIALGFTFLFFMIYPTLRSIINDNILVGVCYGVFVWSVMKFIVLPLSRTPSQPYTVQGTAIAVAILIICVGIPLAVIAGKSNPVKQPD